MSYSKKSLEELNIMDDFLINAVTSNPEVGEDFCRYLLSVLLQKKIGKVRVVSQKSIPALTPEMRGIRMDVEVEEIRGEGRASALNVYDLEPHIQDNIDIPRHNRFYQAKIDSRYMKRGQKDFDKLPNLYVITILDYDPFGYDYMVYHVNNKFEEIPEVKYDDGLQFLYFYTKGKKGGNEAIKSLLNYCRESTEENVVNADISKIHDYVKWVKIQPEVRNEYMRFDDIIYYQRLDSVMDCVLDVLAEYGEVPEELQRKIRKQSNMDLMKEWHKLAVKVSSVKEFEEVITQSEMGGKRL